MRASQLDQSMASMPPPAVQPILVVDAVLVVPRLAPGRHQPRGFTVPQNALASRWIQDAPPVAYSNMVGVIRNPARARALASQLSLIVAISLPGLPACTPGLGARFSAPGMPLMVLLPWP